jgi:hypothetical protein
LLVVVLSISVAVLGLAVPAQAGERSTSGSVVAHLSSRRGPLSPRAMQLRGRHLDRISRIRFGKIPATQLRHLTSHKIAFRAPGRSRPGNVVVSIRVARRWHNVAH